MFLECPNCKANLTETKSVSPDSTPLQGDVFFCGSCAHISILHGPSLQLATQEEFDGFSARERADLKFAVKCILGQSQKQQDRKIIVPDWYK